MSLIQDALKRKSEEAPAENPAPVQEPAPAPEKEPKSPQPILMILIVVLIIALLIALGGLAFSLIRSAKVPRPPVSGTNGMTVVEAMPQEVPVAPVVVVPPVIQPPNPTAIEETIEPVVTEKPVADVTPEWPELKLTGIAQTGSRKLAVLNGKMIPAGRTLGEVTVIEINDKTVVVKYRDEQRTLYINE